MNLKNIRLTIVAVLMMCLGSVVRAEIPFKGIVCPSSPSRPELTAAREIRRYVYLRTGNLLGVSQSDKIPRDSSSYIIVGRKDRAIIKGALSDSDSLSGSQSLKDQEYLLVSVRKGGRTLTVISGGDVFGVLYAGYGFSEKLGVRFYLHGDVIPDAPFSNWAAIKRLNETQKPHFKIRGLNPWGSHPQGIDIWRVDDWKSVISQLAKLKMNFVGIHGYPEFWQMDQQEPTVWMGFPEDVNPNGTVKWAPPSRFFNTQLPVQWGMAGPKNTSKYHFGAAMIYDRDDWGNVLTQGVTPFPKTAADSVKVFNRAGDYYRKIFTYAKSMGLKTATGTTTPLMLPKSALGRMDKLGHKYKYDTDIHIKKGHTHYDVDPKLTAKIYEGIFKRIINTHPLDYYWFWTDESWRFKPNLIAETVKDMQIGVKTGKAMKVPFKFASTGWIVGPKGDGTLFHKEMPNDFAISSIGMKFISEPIESEYATMPGRERWPIVWLTKWDHVNQTQFWVGNMKRAAADARKYKTEGLIGLTWKIRNIAPNIAALAQLQWRSEGWTVPAFYRDWALHQFGTEAAPQIARLLSANDGKDPLQGGWVVWNGPPGGPGRLQDNVAKWTLPEQMAKLRPLIKGKGNLDRFDYWLNGLRYTKAYGQVKTDHSKVAEAYRLMLENASTRGDMGSFANWEQLIFPRNKIDESSMPMKYEGKPRIFVPTVRGNLDSGEALSLEVIILDKGAPRNMALYLRPMGRGAFQKKPLTHVARSVHRVKLPAAEKDMEYYIKATSSDGADLYFPPTAPKINQTLVVSPAYDAARGGN